MSLMKRLSQGIYIYIAFIGLMSCGSKSNKNSAMPNNEPPKTTNSEPETIPVPKPDPKPEVPDLTGDQDALALIQNLTVNDSANAPTECLNILLHAPQDIEWKTIQSSDKSDLRQFYCSLDEGTLSTFFYDKVSKASNSSEGGGIEAGFPIEGIPVNLKLNANANRGSAYTHDMATQDSRTFKKQVCTQSQHSEDHGRTEQTFRKYASPVTLDKYNACITVRQHGFTCHVEETPEGVAAVIKWEPNEIVRKKLPKVLLQFPSAQNLELSSNEYPKVLGIGTGQAVSFHRKVPSQSSLFQVVAHDSGNAVSLACSRVIPPQKPQIHQIWSQHSVCGDPIVKVRDIMQTFQEIDHSKPETRTIPGAVHQEPFKGSIACDHSGLRTFGRELCTTKNLLFVSEEITTHGCFVLEGLFSRWSEAYDVKAICKDPDTVETFFPHTVSITKKIGEERREMPKACIIDDDLPGAKAITEEQAKAINDPNQFGS